MLIATLFAITSACEPPADQNFDAPLVAALRNATPGKVQSVLHFRAPLTPDQHRELRNSGVVLEEYLGNDGYLATVPIGSLLGEGALATLSAAKLLTPQEKIDSQLADPPWWTRRGDRIAVVVEFLGEIDPDKAAATLRAVSRDPIRLGAATWSIEVSPADLLSIASLDAVKRVHSGRIPALPLLDMQRTSTRTDAAQDPNLVPPHPLYSADGSLIRVAICDDGIDTAHDDFRGIKLDGKLDKLRVAPTQAAGKDHGTHVASIVAGSGYRSVVDNLSPFDRRGHSPYALLGDFPRFGSEIEPTYKAVVDGKMRISNHSCVQSRNVPIVYDVVAAELDAIVRGDADYNGSDIPARPQVWSAGNNGEVPQFDYITKAAGYYSVYASAKNTIAVGSVNAPNDDLSPFSSLGPTPDGRIKPDLVAPGWRPYTGIQAASAGYVGGYSGLSGTSFAAPAVTGVLVLVMHDLKRAGTNLDGVLPSTYKALLVHAATDLSEPTPRQGSHPINNPDTKQQPSFHPGPDFATGWGRINADVTLELAQHKEQWTEDGLEVAGSSVEYCIAIPAGATELKVTLAWDDLPGSSAKPYTTSKLVNDLDLTLVGPGLLGKTVLPWTVDPPPIIEKPDGTIVESFTAADIKPAYRGADHRNNVEMVVESAPANGTWKAVVTAHQLPMAKGQRYSLVASHALSRECP